MRDFIIAPSALNDKFSDVPVMTRHAISRAIFSITFGTEIDGNGTWEVCSVFAALIVGVLHCHSIGQRQ